MNALTGVFPIRNHTAAWRTPQPRRPRLLVGLINNMPDAALGATQRQFARLLGQVAGDDGSEIVLRCYCLPEIARDAAARQFIERHYQPLQSLRTEPPDALIISGAAPVAPELPEEPYWRALTDLLDWAWSRRIGLVLSCLAAHAAVLYADQVKRRRLAQKCCGVFTHVARGEHALLRGVPGPIRTPHSRWNDLAEDELVAAGYQILTASADAGVDMFVHPDRPATLYLNGHPEYDGDTLLREYRRDVAGFLGGRQADYPDLPRWHFDAASERAFEAFRRQAEAERSPGLLAAFPAPSMVPGAPWQPLAAALFRNWLDDVHERAI